MTDVFSNARQQDILQKLMQAEWTPHPRLAPAGDSVFGGLVNKGWIESRPADDGPACYRITEAGMLAFNLPIP